MLRAGRQFSFTTTIINFRSHNSRSLILSIRFLHQSYPSLSSLHSLLVSPSASTFTQHKMKVATTLFMFGLATLSAATPQYQVQNDNVNNIVCTKQTGLAAYCAGGDIIIRCNNGVGTAGNCNDNLADQPPFGDNGLAGCYQSSMNAGDAACTKAGLVYPASGSGSMNYNKTMPFPIPGTLAGSNVTTSVQAGPASATGNLDPLFKTVYTTSIVVTNCNGTNVPEHTAAPALSGDHHWANATAIVTVLPAPVTPSVAAAAAATTVATSSSSVAPSSTASASATAPVNFTGAAAASSPASLSFILGAALAAYALL